eukprot:jgi/Botrbrau1/4059/Bobra.152_3s0015.1
MSYVSSLYAIYWTGLLRNSPPTPRPHSPRLQLPLTAPLNPLNPMKCHQLLCNCACFSQGKCSTQMPVQWLTLFSHAKLLLGFHMPVHLQVSSLRVQDAEPRNREPILQRLLRWSILEFESPDLESGYQRHLASQRWGYMLAFAPMFLLGWLQIFYCMASDGRGNRFQLPPGFVASSALYLLPTTGLISFMWLCPQMYARHWRGINVIFMMVHVFSSDGFQTLCLWQRNCTARSWLQVFAVENLYLTIICLRVMIFSTGQACDVLYTVVGLVLAVAGNNALCASPLCGPPRVTLSPPIVVLAHKGCSWLLSVLSACGVFAQCPPSGELSCPAVLGLWQVVGCGLACFLIIVRELMSRRAYLRSCMRLRGSSWPPGGATWPPGGATWPLSHARTLHNLICALFAVCFAPAVILALALIYLQVL